MLLFAVCEGLLVSVMGAKQTKEDETPTSPKSPRVAPVDHASSGDETPVPALLDKEDSRGDELTHKSSGTVALRDDNAESPVVDAPDRAASQRSLSRRLVRERGLPVHRPAQIR